MTMTSVSFLMRSVFYFFGLFCLPLFERVISESLAGRRDAD